MTTRDHATGRFTAERTTTTVTERVTIETCDHGPPLAHTAPGWTAIDPADPGWASQRHDQVLQVLDVLRMWADSHKDGDIGAINAAIAEGHQAGHYGAAAALVPAPEGAPFNAVTILRAGPGASDMERFLGRS